MPCSQLLRARHFCFCPCILGVSERVSIPSVRHFWSAFWIPYREAKLRHYVWKPLIISIGIYLLMFCAGCWVAGASIASLFNSWGWYDEAGTWIGRVLFLVLMYFVSVPIFVMLSTVVSGQWWEKLARELEEHMTGNDPGEPQLSVTERATDIVFRVIVSVIISIGALVGGFFCLGIPAVILTGIVVLFDFTAPAYANRSLIAPMQMVQALRIKRWPIFVVVGGLIAVVPLLLVAALPGLVSVGTAMVASGRLGHPKGEVTNAPIDVP